MYTKAQIFNMALGALLLQRQITDPDTDKSNEAKVLLANYPSALYTTLQDLDLDSTSSVATLELVTTDPVPNWLYSYKYPTDCVHFRRIDSGAVVDNKTTHIPKRVLIHGGQKVIFTNQEDAMAEYISNTVPLSSLSGAAGQALAYRLAWMSSPLIVGKGAEKIKKELFEKYAIFKAEAQEQDRLENFSFVDDAIESEFVETRTS